MNTHIYEVEYLNRDKKLFASNIIVEHLLEQVDREVYQRLFIDEIVDHWKLPEAIPKEQKDFQLRYGTMRKVRITWSWEVYAQQKYGSCSWITINDQK